MDYYVCYNVDMYIDVVPNRNSRPAILLRESYRVGKKVKKRTLANLTNWPPELVENFRALLKGDAVVGRIKDSFDVVASLPHGHVAAVLGTLKKLGLDKLTSNRRCRERDMVGAMIVGRVIDPCSKFSTSRAIHSETSTSTLGELLNVGDADEDDLYAAMDWLLERQERIEQGLAKKHLGEGSLILYDLTSTYFEGRTCPLAKYGHSRDGKRGKLQIVFGLLCSREGIPVGVEVFEGNTSDSMTLASQIKKVRDRFGLKRVVLVGDRGMITQTRIDDDIRGADGMDYITALRAGQIGKLVDSGALQMSLFDERDLAEIESPDFPGERLIACRNPLLAGERARKREELLEATERELDKIVAATHRDKRALRGADKIGVRVGKVLGKFKVGKHFITKITDESFEYERDVERIAKEAALDGIYIIRTTVGEENMSGEEVVRSYKSLSRVERAFRSLKTVDIKVRPIHHRKSDRVRAHVFLCMLAYYVEWHMRRALAPILFDDDDPENAESLRRSIVAPAQRSPKAGRKARTKRNDDGYPVQSFRSLMKCLATITKNTHQPKMLKLPAFDKIKIPTRLQQHAIDLLCVRL